MIPTARAQLARIKASAKLAVDLPAAFTAALAAARQLVEQTEALEGHTERLNTAVIDALLNNGDPAKDTEVRKLAVLRVIGTSGIREAGSQRAGEMIEQAVAEHGGELIDSWGSLSANRLRHAQ